MLDEMKISDSDKQRIIDYITENELDYNITEGIFRFGLVSYDNQLFNIYKNNEQYVLVKMDPDKDFQAQYDPGVMAYEYYYYQNLQQVIEQLSLYDNAVYKVWWELLDGHNNRPSSANMGFTNEGYTEDWFSDHLTIDKYNVEDYDDQYKYVVYEDKRPIKVISPHNTLHEVSLFNNFSMSDMDRLYVEIHPISLKEKNESYLVKILINNEPVLKEWINYRVFKKKGLNLFLEELLNNKNQYVQINPS